MCTEHMQGSANAKTTATQTREKQGSNAHLGAAHDCRHGLHRRTYDVVVGVLFRQRVAAGLAVCAQQQALGGLGVELLLHQLGPHLTGSAQLGDLHVEVHACYANAHANVNANIIKLVHTMQIQLAH